jgi:hypothetical protein
VLKPGRQGSCATPGPHSHFVAAGALPAAPSVAAAVTPATAHTRLILVTNRPPHTFDAMPGVCPI